MPKNEKPKKKLKLIVRNIRTMKKAKRIAKKHNRRLKGGTNYIGRYLIWLPRKTEA